MNEREKVAMWLWLKWIDAGEPDIAALEADGDLDWADCISDAKELLALREPSEPVAWVPDDSFNCDADEWQITCYRKQHPDGRNIALYLNPPTVQPGEPKMSDRIRRGRDRIHGAHKDDPQYREWVKLYHDGEGDRVMRTILSEDLLAFIASEPLRDDEPKPNVTILLHDGDKVGPFEPWMVEVLDGVLFVLRDLIASGTTNLEETGELLKIRAALGSLWKEGE